MPEVRFPGPTQQNPGLRQALSREIRWLKHNSLGGPYKPMGRQNVSRRILTARDQVKVPLQRSSSHHRE